MVLQISKLFRTESLRALVEKYEHSLAPFAFVAGFMWDTLTLRRIDLWLDNLILISYLIIAGASIVLLNGRMAGRLTASLFEFIPLLLQFVLGGLFSAFVIFYWRSASLAASWPFILVLAFFFVGNEVFRERYQKLSFHTSIYFIALFSYSIFSVPILAGKISDKIFLVSGAVSLGLIALFVFLLYSLYPARVREAGRPLFISITGIYCTFIILYFSNIIPPIPLSLKEGGLYHSIQHTSQGYAVTFEPAPWYASFFQETDSTVHWVPGTPLIAFTAIFAPTKINTSIFHHWYYYDEASAQWISSDKPAFPIIGGRDGGYRGYTLKTGLHSGTWRVDVETARGQILGRIPFTVVEVVAPPELKEATH